MGYVQRALAEDGRRYLLAFRPHTLRCRFGPWMSKAEREAVADAHVRSRGRPAPLQRPHPIPLPMAQTMRGAPRPIRVRAAALLTLGLLALGLLVSAATAEAKLIPGSAKSERLTGTSKVDRLFAGRGNDVSFARDKRRDYVYCGPGLDVAVVDVIDIKRGCETKIPPPAPHLKAPRPPVPPSTEPGPPPVGPGPAGSVTAIPRRPRPPPRLRHRHHRLPFPRPGRLATVRLARAQPQ